MTEKSILVVGIGSAHGDDQAGWRVVQQLQNRIDDHSLSVQLAKSPVDLLDWLDGIRHLIICDASRGLGEPGTIHSFRWPSQDFDIETSGTHNLNLTAVLQLATELGRLPEVVELHLIEGQTSAANSEVCPAVGIATEKLVQDLMRQLETTTVAESCTNDRS